MEPWASFWDSNISSVDITMSANKQTATRTGTTMSGYATALSSPSGRGNVYVEATISFLGPGNTPIGIANINETQYPGATNNSIGLYNNGDVMVNGFTIAHATSAAYNNGDIVAIAVNGPTQTVAFRNVTQNSAWTQYFPVPLIGLPPYHLALGTYVVGEGAYANFYGPFVGTPPPGFSVWNPEALFSEQPVKVIDFDALLTDGSYTSSNLQDLENIPFSYVKWGDAVLDAHNNLLFTDWVIDDLPIFSIVLQAAGPANNWLWAAWDYGTPFVFDKVHIPSTAAVAVSNIEIPPPPPTANPQHPGQGHVLQIFSSCDNGQVFSWTQGRVHGVEDVLVWAPIEYATWPPSVIGQAQPVIGNSIQGGRFGPPIGPPLGS